MAALQHISSSGWELKCKGTDQIRLLDKDEDALSLSSLDLICFVLFLSFFFLLTPGCCCGKCMCV